MYSTRNVYYSIMSKIFLGEDVLGRNLKKYLISTTYFGIEGGSEDAEDIQTRIMCLRD